MNEPILPMEVMPMPLGAIELSADQAWQSERALAVAALQQVLSGQASGLPLGPETAAEDDGRLLSLNRFALQLVTGGLLAFGIQNNVCLPCSVCLRPTAL